MSAQDLIGYIISSLNLIAFITIHICRNSLKTANDVDIKLENNFMWTYKEYISLNPPTSIEEPSFKLAVKNIYSMHKDIPTLARAKYELMLIRKCALYGFIIIMISVLFSLSIDKLNLVQVKFVITYVIPIIIMVFELYLLKKCLENEDMIDGLKKHTEAHLESFEQIGTTNE